MARRSLRPQLNQIRAWVRQGRTDAWIAHQLEATVQQISAFKSENELAPDGNAPAAEPGTGFDDEIDLRAEDDALIAVELDKAEADRAKREAEQAERDAKEAAEREEARAARAAAGEPDEEDQDDSEDSGDKPKRRRGRRGGRGRKRTGPVVFEGTFDHGDEGYGLWLDPAVADDSVYAEHWAGHRPVVVTVEESQIVIRRGGEDAEDAAE